VFESHIRVGLGVVCGSPDLIMRFVVVVEVVVVGLGVVISAASTLVLVTCPCCSEELPFFGNV
jgi:hypothetical protein